MLGAACSPIQLFNLSTNQLFHHPVCSFLLAQKRTKKGQPKTKTARFRRGISIGLLYYCGEQQRGLDQRRLTWFSYSTNQLFNFSFCLDQGTIKGQPKTKRARLGRGNAVRRLCYCGEQQRALILD